MLRRILVWVTLFALLAGTLAPINITVYGTDEPTVFVDPKNSIFSTTEKRVGDTFQINCTVANVTGPAGLAFHLSWDPTLLVCTGIQEVLFHTVTPPEFWDNIWNLALTYNNTAGTADYAVTWQDLYQAVVDGYAPANITTNEYPEGKLAAAIITLSIVSEPVPGGFKECSLDLSDTKMQDINANPIDHAVNNGYYKLTRDLLVWGPVQVYVDPSTVTTVPGEMFNVSISVSIPWPQALDLVGWQLWLNPIKLNYISSTSFWPSTGLGGDRGQYAVGGVATGILLTAFGVSKVFTVTFQSLSYGISQINITDFVLMGKSDTGNGWPPNTPVFNGIPEFTEYARWPDINHDGAINIYDTIAFMDSFYTSKNSVHYNSACDFNNDGFVDLFDAEILACDFNKDTNSPTWPNSTYPNGLTQTIFQFNETVQNGSVHVTIPGDINGDFTVDLYDAILLSNAFNSQPNSPNWDANADINRDNIVDLYDAILLSNHFNQHYP